MKALKMQKAESKRTKSILYIEIKNAASKRETFIHERKGNANFKQKLKII